MEIVSNWGSPSRLGLTELQFFDQDGHLIALDANDISVHGATGCKHDLDVLCNGKTKVQYFVVIVLEFRKYHLIFIITSIVQHVWVHIVTSH